MRTFLVLVLVTTLTGLGSATAHAAVTTSTYQKQILERTNAVRAAQDRPAVKMQSCLDGYADAWAKRLATQTKTLKHRSSTSLRTIMKRCKLDGIGENLAVGYSTGTRTVDAWSASPGHRANQLNKGYRHVGIGVYRDAKNRYWAVALYGNPR